jgi:hypothetical protein
MCGNKICQKKYEEGVLPYCQFVDEQPTEIKIQIPNNGSRKTRLFRKYVGDAMIKYTPWHRNKYILYDRHVYFLQQLATIFKNHSMLNGLFMSERRIGDELSRVICQQYGDYDNGNVTYLTFFHNTLESPDLITYKMLKKFKLRHFPDIDVDEDSVLG